MARISFKIDNRLKTQLKELLDYAGLDFSSFYLMMTRQTIMSQSISCIIKREEIVTQEGESSRISFTIDDRLKNQLKGLLDYAGLDMTSFYLMMTRQAVLNQHVYCSIKKENGNNMPQQMYDEKPMEKTFPQDKTEYEEKIEGKQDTLHDPESKPPLKLSDYFRKDTSNT